METTLHRQLKALYSSDAFWNELRAKRPPSEQKPLFNQMEPFQKELCQKESALAASRQEVVVDGFRVDAVVDGQLIEIQYASLGAIRNKIRSLLVNHSVLVVKPLAARKYLIKRKRKRGPISSSRYSPLRQTYFHLFDDLVHFVDIFPHARLTLDVLLTEQEEHRLPAANRRRWRRRRDYRVEDRHLRSVRDRWQLRTVFDLVAALPAALTGGDRDASFSTADLAREAEIPRWLAQKAAYCLRKTGAATVVAKSGNALLYQINASARRAA